MRSPNTEFHFFHIVPSTARLSIGLGLHILVLLRHYLAINSVMTLLTSSAVLASLIVIGTLSAESGLLVLNRSILAGQSLSSLW